ncbi:MAG: hypothetical protein HOE11_03805 [Candidatus Diapherotrites archaeon]|jgi:hypothetical protein|nr:hypothetical protein [Candidatus Diapherotrites archaeon]MBT4596953.1 hypothetical protein [Candidatus Diapherotrites archaeon]
MKPTNELIERTRQQFAVEKPAARQLVQRFKEAELARVERLVKSGLPLPLALHLTHSQRRLSFTPLQQRFFSKLRAQSPVTLKKAVVTLKPAKLILLENRKHLASIASIRFFANPTKETRASMPELGTHIKGDLGQASFGEEARDGSIGEIDAGIIKIGRTPTLIVTNAQARARLYGLSAGKRARFRDWYEKCLDEIMAQTGIKQIIIPTNEMLNESLQANLTGHRKLGDKVLDPFYSGFARKRNYSPIQLSLSTKTGQINGNFWIKRE